MQPIGGVWWALPRDSDGGSSEDLDLIVMVQYLQLGKLSQHHSHRFMGRFGVEVGSHDRRSARCEEHAARATYPTATAGDQDGAPRQGQRTYRCARTIILGESSLHWMASSRR